jgi:hypothetical protein
MARLIARGVRSFGLVSHSRRDPLRKAVSIAMHGKSQQRSVDILWGAEKKFSRQRPREKADRAVRKKA